MLHKKAMEKAVVNGKTNWGYVETILKDWSNKRLLTLEAVEAGLALEESTDKRSTAS
ncbi:DnaD domain protein [Lysinibacillus xylanilyticus]|uniref:DnaD domain protein n=1 Tax=Lysinibacillus xylanilyticus TaxID=582475 RepID=UPI00381A2C19